MGGRWSIIGGARELGLGIVKLLHFPSFFPSSEEPVQNTQNSFIDDTRPQGKVPGFLSELSGTLKLSFPNWVLFESFADAEMAARQRTKTTTKPIQQSRRTKASGCASFRARPAALHIPRVRASSARGEHGAGGAGDQGGANGVA